MTVKTIIWLTWSKTYKPTKNVSKANLTHLSEEHTQLSADDTTSKSISEQKFTRAIVKSEAVVRPDTVGNADGRLNKNSELRLLFAGKESKHEHVDQSQLKHQRAAICEKSVCHTNSRSSVCTRRKSTELKCTASASCGAARGKKEQCESRHKQRKPNQNDYQLTFS